jgi:glutamate-1-semialdehyde 2,1-aminomutase
VRTTVETESGGADLSPASRQQALLARARRAIAGGSLGLFTLPAEVDFVVASGQGGHLTDVAGRDYVDFHLGSGPALLGHGHPAITRAVSEQVAKGSTYYFLNEPAIELAETMVESIPCAESLQFAGSGSEATLHAMRIARAATGRDLVLKFEGAWHGMNDYALWGTVPTSASPYPAAEPDSAGIPTAVGEQVLVTPFNEAARFEALVADHADRLAAVIVEPLQRVLTPEPGFLETVREVTRRHGIVLIFDEVVTGFRIAWAGAQERYGVVPDLATYGKAMSGGFPMAAIVGRRDLMRFIDASRTERARLVWAGGTLNGNPVASAAGLASLRILRQPGAYEHLHALGGRLRRGIEASARDHGVAAMALGEDAVFGVRFLDGERPRTWVELLRADRELGRRWALELITRGVLVNPNEKLYVSIAHTDADIDRALDAVDEAFATVARDA